MALSNSCLAHICSLIAKPPTSAKAQYVSSSTSSELAEWSHKELLSSVTFIFCKITLSALADSVTQLLLGAPFILWTKWWIYFAPPPLPKVLQHPLHPNAKNLPQIHLWFHVLVQMSRKYSPNAEPRFRANPCSTLSNTRGHIFGRILQIHRWAKRWHGHACKSSGMSNVRLRPKLAACNSGFARTRSFAEWNVAKLSRCLCPLLNPFLVQACSASGG